MCVHRAEECIICILFDLLLDRFIRMSERKKSVDDNLLKNTFESRRRFSSKQITRVISGELLKCIPASNYVFFLFIIYRQIFGLSPQNVMVYFTFHFGNRSHYSTVYLSCQECDQGITGWVSVMWLVYKFSNTGHSLTRWGRNESGEPRVHFIVRKPSLKNTSYA